MSFRCIYYTKLISYLFSLVPLNGFLHYQTLGEFEKKILLLERKEFFEHSLPSRVMGYFVSFTDKFKRIVIVISTANECRTCVCVYTYVCACVNVQVAVIEILTLFQSFVIYRICCYAHWSILQFPVGKWSLSNKHWKPNAKIITCPLFVIVMQSTFYMIFTFQWNKEPYSAAV